MLARYTIASLEETVCAKSRHRRRYRPNQPKERSTTQRRGNTVNPFAACGRRTTSKAQPHGLRTEGTIFS